VLNDQLKTTYYRIYLLLSHYPIERQIVKIILPKIKNEFCFSIVIVALAICIAFGNTTQAAEISISMAKDSWSSSEGIEFSLFTTSDNESEPSSGTLPDHVVCILESGGRTHTVIARRMEETDDAKGMAGGQARYAFEPPPRISGAVRMRLSEVQVPVVLFDIEVPQENPLVEEVSPTLDSLFTLYQPYIGNMGAYKPMYFLFGVELSKSKFQISFNYRFVNPESVVAENHPWVKGFHFGYTQTSFWNLGSTSAPFEDNCYKPEMFWVSKNFITAGPKVKGVFLQTGFQHESNGRGGETSRSTNFLYAQPIFMFLSNSRHYLLQLSPKFWAYAVNDNETNPDLDRYRGYFDLGFKIGKMDSFVLNTSLRWAAEGPSVQLDLTYPLHRFLFNTLDSYIHAQYTNALAENLLEYQERSHAFRIGFSMVR
jgi:outer membrane phospholipase A